jgi:cysteine sulfinate desulfinase
MLDVQAIRSQFPALNTRTEESLVYLDNAATTQKPASIINAITEYYQSQNANVHRGSHKLTSSATAQFEQARQVVADFIGAKNSKEVIWTRGATESINLVAQTFARSVLKTGDIILVGEAEHHANIVPWQIIAQQTGALVVKIPVNHHGELNWEKFANLITGQQVKIVALAHVTNVTGSRQPIEEAIKLSHQYGAIVVIDGAQGIVHEKVNVAELDADFYLFSGHKLYAPTGIGILYGKQNLLEAMPPWHGGGKMVEKVSFEQTIFTGLPGKFEAGTPNIAGAIALSKAIQWYQQWSLQSIESHIHHLQKRTYQGLIGLEGVRIIGYQSKASVLSFIVEGVHPQDIATLLDQQGIAVRSGHHCAHPLMGALKLNGTVRISFGIYNTEQDVEALLQALEKALDIL